MPATCAWCPCLFSQQLFLEGLLRVCARYYVRGLEYSAEEAKHSLCSHVNLSSVGAITQVVSIFSKLQFSSVAQSCLTLCEPMDYSTLGFPVHHQLLELAQTHVHWVNDAIQPSHSLSSPYPPAFNLSQHQGLFQWVSSSHQVVKVLELQHQSFRWIFRTDFL